MLQYNNLTSLSSPVVINKKSETFSIHDAPESIALLTKIKYIYLDDSSYDINNLDYNNGSNYHYNNVITLPL